MSSPSSSSNIDRLHPGRDWETRDPAAQTHELRLVAFGLQGDVEKIAAVLTNRYRTNEPAVASS